MTLTSADFIYPTGEIQASFFPKETLATLIDAWIDQAETKVASIAAADQDTAAAFWVYYRAYSAIAMRIGANPSRMTFGGNSGGGVESSVDWGQNKSDYWANLAQAALDNFHYYVPAVPPVDETPAFDFYFDELEV